MTSKIEQWLIRIGLERYVPAFRDNDIDFRSFDLLSETDLKELGVTLGHRRILRAEAAKRLTVEAETRSQQPDGHRESTLAGERRQLTVAFCDIVGATRLSREIDPEDFREIIQRYQNTVVASVVRFDGYVAKFLGDGVLAYFGWPRAYEDQAERAVLASTAAVRDTGDIRIAPRRSLRARGGIATGEVVVGDLVGDALTDAEAVIGETPNLAARLQSAARPGEVLIDAATRTLIATTFALEGRGARRLKGFDESVETWLVRGEGDEPSRFMAKRGTQDATIVGREQEMANLHTSWNETRAGNGQVVVLSGDGGIGKSALVTAFVNSVAQDYASEWRCQCWPYHTNNAFYPIKRLFSRAAGFTAADSMEIKRNKLERWWKTLQADRADFPVISALLEIAGDDPSIRNQSPQQLRERVADALLAQIATVSDTPVLLVVEDVHWSDPSTMALLNRMVNRIESLPVMLLVTTRPTTGPLLTDAPHVTRHKLEGLPNAPARSIVRAIGGRRLEAEVVSGIVQRADGNPLCLEELTKSVLGSELTADSLSDPDRIPMTLQSSLIARLDQLNSAKELAQIGAVIGHRFSFQLLRQVYQRPDDEIAVALGQLLQSGMVVEQIIGNELHYRFRHALMHDAAYATILRADRRRLHQRIVDILKSDTAETYGMDRRLDLLAYHTVRAELWEDAFRYCHLAASQALRQSALQEAVGLFGQALDVAQQLPQTRAVAQDTIDMRFELRNALWSLGANDEIITQLRVAEEIATEIGDERRLGWVSVYRGASLWLVGRNAEAQEATRRAVSIGETASDLPLLTASDFYFGCALVQCGDYATAAERFRRIMTALASQDEDDFIGLPFAPSVVVRSWLVWSLSEMGDFDDALKVAEEGLAIAERVNHPFSHAHILYDIGYLHLMRGAFAEAVDVLAPAREITAHWHLGNLDLFVTGFLGYARLRSGEVEEGTALLDDCVQRYENQGSGLFHSLALNHLAEARLILGELDEARRLGEHSLALARQRGERGHMAYSMCLLGDVSSYDQGGGRDKARDHYQSALDLATIHGMAPLQAQCESRLAALPTP